MSDYCGNHDILIFIFINKSYVIFRFKNNEYIYKERCSVFINPRFIGAITAVVYAEQNHQVLALLTASDMNVTLKIALELKKDVLVKYVMHVYFW